MVRTYFWLVRSYDVIKFFRRSFRKCHVWKKQSSGAGDAGWDSAGKMAYAPKNDGRPNVKFYESADILSLFEGVKSWLMKNAKKVRARYIKYADCALRHFRRAVCL